ncbi:MAG: hypothetical protein ABJV04_20685, partial [Aliiglaciecola sp.]|uniref:hypothetical protein n=1 Tax=Aliiglaciecola sp. TaxID=1872441 RepID=UPI0032991E4D
TGKVMFTYLYRLISRKIWVFTPLVLEILYSLYSSTLNFYSILLLVSAIFFIWSFSFAEGASGAVKGGVSDLITMMLRYKPYNYKLVDKNGLIKKLELEGVKVFDKSNFYLKQMFNNLKIYTVRDTYEKTRILPTQVITFPTIVGAWIFLPSDYEKMNGIGKFQLLHEIGHLSKMALSKGLQGSYVHVYFALIFGIYILLRSDAIFIPLLLVLASIFLTFLYVKLISEHTKMTTLIDELEADNFALRRAKVEWFKDYPSQKIAKKLCSRGDDFKRENQIWIDHFSETLDKKRSGEQIGEVSEKYIINDKPINKPAIDAILIARACSVLACLFWFVPAEPSSVIMILVMSIITLLVMSFWAYSQHQVAKLVTSAMDIDSQSEQYKSGLEGLMRSITKLRRYRKLNDSKLLHQIYLLLMEIVVAHEKVKDETGKLAQHPVLFDSVEQFDVYCDIKNDKNYIFYGPEVNHRFCRAEFQVSGARLLFFDDMGATFDLGISITSQLSNCFKKDQYIEFTQTVNKQRVNSQIIPLKVRYEQNCLFKDPADFDIYCDVEKGINYIFHGPELECDFDHIEFHDSTRRMFFYTKDGRKLDLGAKIQWLVYPHICKDQNILVIRTKDGVAIDGHQIALKVIN